MMLLNESMSFVLMTNWPTGVIKLNENEWMKDGIYVEAKESS